MNSSTIIILVVIAVVFFGVCAYLWYTFVTQPVAAVGIVTAATDPRCLALKGDYCLVSSSGMALSDGDAVAGLTGVRGSACELRTFNYTDALIFLEDYGITLDNLNTDFPLYTVTYTSGTGAYSFESDDATITPALKAKTLYDYVKANSSMTPTQLASLGMQIQYSIQTSVISSNFSLAFIPKMTVAESLSTVIRQRSADYDGSEWACYYNCPYYRNELWVPLATLSKGITLTCALIDDPTTDQYEDSNSNDYFFTSSVDAKFVSTTSDTLAEAKVICSADPDCTGFTNDGTYQDVSINQILTCTKD